MSAAIPPYHISCRSNYSFAIDPNGAAFVIRRQLAVQSDVTFSALEAFLLVSYNPEAAHGKDSAVSDELNVLVQYFTIHITAIDCAKKNPFLHVYTA